MPSLQDRRDYRLEGAGYVSQLSYEEKIVGEEKRLFKRDGNNRLCISGLMHEAWCSSVGDATISQSLSEGRGAYVLGHYGWRYLNSVGGGRYCGSIGRA